MGRGPKMSDTKPSADEPAVTARDGMANGSAGGRPVEAAARRPDELAAGDLWLFHEGTHSRLHDVLGGHLLDGGGARFALWAPNAEQVSVIGDLNAWDAGAHPLRPQGRSGIWVGTVPEAAPGHRYKFHIRSRE